MSQTLIQVKLGPNLIHGEYFFSTLDLVGGSNNWIIRMSSTPEDPNSTCGLWLGQIGEIQTWQASLMCITDPLQAFSPTLNRCLERMVSDTINGNRKRLPHSGRLAAQSDSQSLLSSPVWKYIWHWNTCNEKDHRLSLSHYLVHYFVLVFRNLVVSAATLYHFPFKCSFQPSLFAQGFQILVGISLSTFQHFPFKCFFVM